MNDAEGVDPEVGSGEEKGEFDGVEEGCEETGCVDALFEGGDRGCQGLEWDVAAPAVA